MKYLQTVLLLLVTREGLTDSRGMVTFDRLGEQYWSIKACRPGYPIGTLGFDLDEAKGVRFDCGSSRVMIESKRLLMERDLHSPVGPAPDLVMTAREIFPDGTHKNAMASALLGGVFKMNRVENYEHIELRDD